MSGKIIPGTLLLLVSLIIGLSSGCGSGNNQVKDEHQRIALVGGTLIDGRGGEPLKNAVILIYGERIEKVGTAGDFKIPDDSRILDVSGSTILPGFINTHVHNGFVKENLKAWAAGGVTTVRDESLGNRPIEESLSLRENLKDDPSYARLISAGRIIAVPGGYGSLIVNSPEEARRAVLDELALGIDQIKVALEDGYDGETGLAKLTPEELSVIVETAHEAGIKVSGHITESAYIPAMLDAGVDDIAHSAYDPIPNNILQRMVADDVILIPTFTVFRNYGASLDGCVLNLKHFVEFGGMVALGNDYGGGPGDFELGIPMFEIETMSSAGMTSMQIILAGTSNAAIVVGLEDQIGTLESGKIADILVVGGNPLVDLNRLTDIRYVVHYGVIITPSTSAADQ
jgi:imidazolonepropionase-like amidohydrolase